ncbi:MAG TPA: ABC transporter ATP-binding protein [Chitinophagaceae bacterium]|nr:ABC transporter ATP-binding protein [Chitinophagaceae bacterium]HRF16891.1 ABC transporter ATP-binding protein [Chitinophagaceae bacterium]
MISIEHISKRFRKLQVLEDINANMEKGQVISLIGPNGSGKTTLIKSILGMVRPDKGKITVDGHVISGDHSYRANIGYMPQIGRYPDNMRIGQLFRMIENIRGVAADKQDETLIRQFELEKIYDKPMRTLSGGTRQKVSAALAFLFDPAILILDEPTAGLDPLSSELLKDKIIAEKKKNKLILITSHILSDLDELTTHVMYLQEGKLQFFKDMQTLQEETGELRLGKAIARIMKGEKLTNEWIDKILEVKKDEKIY